MTIPPFASQLILKISEIKMKKTLSFIFLIISTTWAIPEHIPITNSDEPTVSTPLGQVRGSILASRLGKQIFTFRGIRYAKAPINELRFQPPVPVEKWDGVYNATADGPLCPQPTNDPTSEDCLSLNVYTAKLPKGADQTRRSVIVYFHAGGFYSVGGASYWEGPQYLLDHEIVLVTLNYRLGTLGFLSTGDKEAPGNNGLKDQVEALKWVQQNIASFGGDPNQVTIMGYSAGGTSVTLHLVSPMSRGLFHRAIVSSGSALGPIPIVHNQLNLAKKQAKIVGCPTDTSANIIKCLKTKTPHELGESLSEFKEFADDPVYIWYPVIEDDFGQPRFLTGHPIKQIINGQFTKVPVLAGITTDEFASRAFTISSNDTLKQRFINEFDKIAPISFIYERDGELSKTITGGLKKFYFNDKFDDNFLAALAQLYADGVTGFSVNRAVKLLAEHSNQSVYYYRFNYKGRYSHFYLPDSNSTIPYGVVHHDDLIYLFYIQKLFPLFKDTDPETQTVNKITKLWTNFAKTGNPIPETSDKLDNVKWEPFQLKSQKYLDIGNKLVLNEKLNEKRYAEWEKLVPLSTYTKNKKHAG